MTTLRFCRDLADKEPSLHSRGLTLDDNSISSCVDARLSRGDLFITARVKLADLSASAKSRAVLLNSLRPPADTNLLWLG